MRWRELLGPAAENVRAVLFDAVGTLITPTTSVAEVYFDFGQRRGSRLETKEIAARFPAALRAAEVCQGRSDERIELDRWRAVVRHVFDDLPETEPLFRELWAHFAEPHSWRLVPRAVELLEGLIAENYLVGVASNFDARLRTVLSGPNRVPAAVNLFISSDLGWQKPHTGYFRGVERALGLSPQELLLIGDDWDNDVCGGRSAGWQTIWVAPTTSADSPSVASLAELCD
ncbi:MAG: HAD-IA family hydrolase [Planctomycetia bacterium]|mgnify:CR=1 FL=1|nr:HAD-IA family hydrolase [Planctomycetia bacterium]